MSTNVLGKGRNPYLSAMSYHQIPKQVFATALEFLLVATAANSSTSKIPVDAAING